MRKRYRVVTIPASLTPYASHAGQIIEMEEEASRQFAGSIVEIPPEPAPVVRAMDVPPVDKMLTRPQQKKGRTRG